MKTTSIKSIIISGILCMMAFACADVEQDNPNDPGADNYEYTGMSVTPPNGSVLQADGDVVIVFTDVMDETSLVLGGDLMGGATPPYTNTSWSSTTLVDDTLTISSPGTEWAFGTGKTLTVECSPLIGRYVSLDLGYTVDMSISASVTPSSGGTLDAEGAVTIKYTRSMNPSSLQITGSAGESTLIADNDANAIIAWTKTTLDNDTLTLTPSNTIWERGTDRTLHIYCESALSSSVKVTSDFNFDVSYEVPVVSITPANGSIITGNEDIVIVFGESMQSSVTFDGGNTIYTTTPASGNGYSWSGNTLTISRNSIDKIWNKGSGKTLSLTCTSTLGATKPTRTLALAYDVFHGTCVRVLNGSDTTGDGTTSKPYLTIQKGNDEAKALYADNGYPAEVRIAEGTYSIIADINMIEKISLYGGYSNAGWTTRGLTSVIDDTRTTGTVAVINFPTGITTATIVDGITLKIAKGYPDNYGILVNGDSAPKIQNISITGRVASGGTSYGIMLGTGDASISGCTVFTEWEGTDPTASGTTSYGIFIPVGSNNPSIIGNTISGGRAYSTTGGACTSYGIYLRSSQGVIQNNNIQGGYSNSSSSASCGIYCRSGSLIQGNTIDGGSHSGVNSSFCIYLELSSYFPTIENNTFVSNSIINSHAIYESSADSDPQTVANNQFDGDFITGNGGYYYDYGETIPIIEDMITSITLRDTNGTLSFFGNNSY